MIRLIPGKKGTGKTKILIDAIHQAEKESKGNVVAIQIGSSLNIDIYHKIRLINIEDFKIADYDDLYGFIAGILASDYDCTDIFVDGVLRIVGRDFNKGKHQCGIHHFCRCGSPSRFHKKISVNFPDRY